MTAHWAFPVHKDHMLESSVPEPPHLGAFGAARKYHIHEGVDIYATDGSPIRSVESGNVVAVGAFTGPSAGSPWWHDTQYIMVEGVSGVVCYGEIIVRALWEVGDLVGPKQLLGHIKQVLRKDKGRPMSMLHLELYEHGVTEPMEWVPHAPCPKGLQDPTRHLQRAFETHLC